MSKSFATLIDEIEQEIQDSSNAVWTAAELAVQLEDAIREVSEYVPYVVKESYKLETRTGEATTTTAGALVDATEAQFLATDVNKVIYNTTDRTWAVVTAYVSTSQLTISKNIMASGEGYKMFNRDCWNERQIYLGDVEDYVGDDHGVFQVEFKVDEYPHSYRNYKVDGNILTVEFDFTPDDSKDSDANVEVFVWLNKRHQVSQLTDLAGALNAAGSDGDTSIAIDDLSGVEVIAEDTEFVITGARGLYRTTAALTLAAGAGTISFWPPLVEDVENNDVITFTGSTLTRTLERIVVELVAARALQSKGAKLLQEANTAITSVASAATALTLVAAKVLRQVTDVASGRTAAGLVAAIITSARTEIDLVNPEVDIAKTSVASAETAADLIAAVILEANTEIDKMAKEIKTAIATLDSGRASIKKTNRGGPAVPGQYATQASQELATAEGYLSVAKGYLEQVAANAEEARVRANELAGGSLGTAQGYRVAAEGYLKQATANAESVQNYLDLGAAEITGAAGSVNEALGFLEKAASELAITVSVREWNSWAREKAERALTQLRRGRAPNQVRVYSRE